MNKLPKAAVFATLAIALPGCGETSVTSPAPSHHGQTIGGSYATAEAAIITYCETGKTQQQLQEVTKAIGAYANLRTVGIQNIPNNMDTDLVVQMNKEIQDFETEYPTAATLFDELSCAPQAASPVTSK